MKENGDKEIGIDYWKFCKILHEKKNSLVKFIELFMSQGYRHLQNKVLENSQNFPG